MDDDDEDWLGLDLSGNQPKFATNTEGLGHNSLGSVADRARAALSRVYAGEEMSWEAWRDYGKALNEGREAFPSNEEFGKWVVSEGLDKFVQSNLDRTKVVHTEARVAAMWIASEPEEEQEALSLFPNISTPRGLYSKWKAHLKKLLSNPRGSGSNNSGLRSPDEKEKKRIKNLKDRAASTTSEPERDAVNKKLAKMKEDGIDVDMVEDQEEYDENRDEYFKEKDHREEIAVRLAKQFISDNRVRLVRHLILVAYPETAELEQFELDNL